MPYLGFYVIHSSQATGFGQPPLYMYYIAIMVTQNKLMDVDMDMGNTSVSLTRVLSTVDES